MLFGICKRCGEVVLLIKKEKNAQKIIYVDNAKRKVRSNKMENNTIECNTCGLDTNDGIQCGICDVDLCYDCGIQCPECEQMVCDSCFNQDLCDDCFGKDS